jgi:sterol desaturase/sphingolipid hydroxylase (fatty acid hydroxylase superfamily)
MTGQMLATALLLGGLFLILFACERSWPLRQARQGPGRRLLVNLSISALAIGTAAAVVEPAGAIALEHVSTRGFGLLSWIEFPATMRFVIGFALLDLTFYYWHLANHKISFLWRFHNVHHIDRDLDVSTAFRFHFGEVAMSAGFRVLQILLLGVSPVNFAIYELVFQANTIFHHSNVRLPLMAERWLNRILVTPRMHGIHHSEIQRENNSNFSVVFPWWDGLHRTLRLNVPQSQIVIGIPAYPTAADDALGRTLIMPFRRQRSYWRRPDGTSAERDQTDIKLPASRMVA